MPQYLMGCIHDVSVYLHGSLRLSVSLHESMSRASSLTSTVRHGVVQGVCMKPFMPVASGVSHDSNTMFLSSRLRCIVG